MSSPAIANCLKSPTSPVLGCWQNLSSPHLTRLLSTTGISWVLLDCEHGNLSDADLHTHIPAATSVGLTPVVRIPDISRAWIKRALDAGAHAVMVPLVSTVEDARRAVGWAKFPPVGERGFGSPFSGVLSGLSASGTGKSYLEEANAGTSVVVQIETREGLENCEEIAAVEGVDVLFLGPYDLSLSLGLPVPPPLQPPHPTLAEAMHRVVAAAKKSGKKAGIYCADGNHAKQFVDMGFFMVCCAADTGSLVRDVSRQVGIVTGKEGREVGYGS